MVMETKALRILRENPRGISAPQASFYYRFTTLSQRVSELVRRGYEIDKRRGPRQTMIYTLIKEPKKT